MRNWRANPNKTLFLKETQDVQNEIIVMCRVPNEVIIVSLGYLSDSEEVTERRDAVVNKYNTIRESLLMKDAKLKTLLPHAHTYTSNVQSINSLLKKVSFVNFLQGFVPMSSYLFVEMF